ncbi:hypothetical protein PV327_005631 [Microctonus hyperodae]|uniref:Protein smoothened n=1 Tax=Microctonus hyperodae TaxID=165561 RepID=A0AA39KZW4_MICHY|nr:hypothetical protein PV327_005631 [Microctonus hyperodae]
MLRTNYFHYFKIVLCLFYVLLSHLTNEATSQFIPGYGSGKNNENNTWTNLELTARHRLEDSSYLLDRYPIGESPADSANCKRSVKCVKMKYNTCMGTPLPYTMTSLDLIPEPITQEVVEERLRDLQALRHIPKCWAVVQPFLCSLFMPKCIDGNVDLPLHEMCKKVSGPCRILFNHTIWPNFIKCDNTKLFPRLCKDHTREIKFNSSGKCLKPLVPTDNSLAIFEGVEGCGTQCHDPLFTPDEHKQIHSFIAWGAGICGVCNLFTVITFLIDWRSANKYPALVIFYINCCFLISCIGWLAQFTSGNRESIVCRKDGTLRMSEPSGGSLSCVVVFVLIYYSLMAAMAWFVILTYAWHMSFQALGKIQDKIDKKGAYFHLIAWCFPLVLTVTIIALGEVDGNSVTGICFVGYTNHWVRAGFLLGPVLAGLLVGGYFLTRGLTTLIRLKISSQEIISERASAKIRDTIIRMGCFSVFTFLAIIITFYCHIYEFRNSWKWRESFKNYMTCSIITKYTENSECQMEHRPSVTKLQLHLLSPFLAGVLMSLWVWTSSTVDTWTRFFRRTFNCEREEPMKLKKHKVIAQAFAKRKTLNHAGRLSISFHNTHEDPVGLNFDLSSVSQDFSSTWAAALPIFVTRRGALVGGNAASISSNRRNSADSQLSVQSLSVQRVTVRSRRNSADSQYSHISMCEMKATRKMGFSSGSRSRRGKRRRDFGKSRSSKVGPLFRRGSTTSQESQLNTQILSSLSIGGLINMPQVPNMKRRSATAGLDGGFLNAKIIHGKNVEMLLPYLFPNRSDSDENLSTEEKADNVVADKNIDIEANTVEKDEHDSADSGDDSQPDEETKMLGTQETQERSRSKISNKSNKSYSNRDVRKSKFIIEDETELKHLLQESKNPQIDSDIDNEGYKKVAIGDLASSLTSYCPELSRLIQTDGQSSSAREMATQTSLPLDVLEMEELKQSIDEIINSRNCTSKGTQISPKLDKINNRNNRKTDNKIVNSGNNTTRLLKDGRRSEKTNN